MSKSYGNHIGITDPPEEIFGKTMRIPDTLLERVVRRAAREPTPPADAGPRDAKRALARALDRPLPRGRGRRRRRGALRAGVRRAARRPRRSRRRPSRPANGRCTCRQLIADVFGGSRSDARRLLAQGGVKLDGEPLAGDAARRRGRAARRRRAAGGQAALQAAALLPGPAGADPAIFPRRCGVVPSRRCPGIASERRSRKRYTPLPARDRRKPAPSSVTRRNPLHERRDGL